MSDFLSLSQAANRTGKSRRTLGRMLDAGEIPGAERGESGTWKIPLEALETAGLLSGDVRSEDVSASTWRERALVAEGRLEEVRAHLETAQSALRTVEGAAAVLDRRVKELEARTGAPGQWIEATEKKPKRGLFRK